MTDIRWKQRFQNFEQALQLLREAVNCCETASKLEKEGTIQRFEYTFELAWKTLKDFLNFQGIEVALPREVIKQSFANELLADGEVWIDMLDKRNMMAHTYQESKFKEALDLICSDYIKALQQVYEMLVEKSD